MKRRYGSQALMTEINITPFTDVILVLLIIFMVATPLISQNSIEVKLPRASTQEAIDDPRQVYITISAEGIVYLNDKIITKKELKQKIDALISNNQALKVIVGADQASRFQEVVGVIDVLKKSGVRNLNIATRTTN